MNEKIMLELKHAETNSGHFYVFLLQLQTETTQSTNFNCEKKITSTQKTT